MIAAPLRNPHQPVEAVLVVIDPGTASSGVSHYVRDRPVSVGAIKGLDPKAMEQVFVTAELLAAAAGGLPIVCVVEKPPPVNVRYKRVSKKGVAYLGTTSGLSKARGVWKHEARRAEAMYAEAPLSTWRSAVLPDGMKRGADTIARAEALIAAGVAKNYGLSFEGLPHDARVALLIGRWAAHAPVIKGLVAKHEAKCQRLLRRVERKFVRSSKGPVLLEAPKLAPGDYMVVDLPNGSLIVVAGEAVAAHGIAVVPAGVGLTLVTPPPKENA